MLRIDTIQTSAKTITLSLEGRVDRQSLPILIRTCEDSLKNEELVILDMERVDHISKEGRDYLKSIKSEIQLINLSEYLKMEFE